MKRSAAKFRITASAKSARSDLRILDPKDKRKRKCLTRPSLEGIYRKLQHRRFLYFGFEMQKPSMLQLTIDRCRIRDNCLHFLLYFVYESWRHYRGGGFGPSYENRPPEATPCAERHAHHRSHDRQV